MRLVVNLALAVALLGCGVRVVPVLAPLPDTPTTEPGPPPTPASDPGFIDLEPGWRLQVVTPLLKSGGYQLKNTTADLDGRTLTVDASGEFLGYETAIYSIEPRKRGGVRVKFQAARVTRNEETEERRRPHVELFDLPRNARHVRLIYLTRLTHADHDMAIVAAKDRGTLEALTLEVRTNPDAACRNGVGHCSWVPAGIAVRPQRIKAGEDEWAPAR